MVYFDAVSWRWVPFLPAAIEDIDPDTDDEVCEEKRDCSIPVEAEVNLHPCLRCGFPLDPSSEVCAVCGHENEVEVHDVEAYASFIEAKESRCDD